jgi:hypothetical protein
MGPKIENIKFHAFFRCPRPTGHRGRLARGGRRSGRSPVAVHAESALGRLDGLLCYFGIRLLNFSLALNVRLSRYNLGRSRPRPNHYTYSCRALRVGL